MQPFYKLFIKDKTYERYKKLASFLFLINAIIFTAFVIRATSFPNKLALFTSSFILIVYAIYNWTYKKKKERSYIIVYLITAAIWISCTPFWYFSIVLLLLLVLHFRMGSSFTISLSAHSILVDGFIKKSYGWKDFNNIILKDHLLTLDFKNNRVLQVEPDWNFSVLAGGIKSRPVEESYPQTEKEFNDFCQEQLRTAASPI